MVLIDAWLMRKLSAYEGADRRDALQRWSEGADLSMVLAGVTMMASGELLPPVPLELLHPVLAATLPVCMAVMPFLGAAFIVASFVMWRMRAIARIVEASC